MPVIQSNYDAIKLLANGHIQTILPFFFRTHPENHDDHKYIIEPTPDNDEIETFLYRADNDDKLVIISHGLEGDAQDCYLTSFATFLKDHHISTLTWNMRTCGGRLNKTTKFYHALQYEDLDLIIDKYTKEFKEIYLVGISLGGALTLNYLTRDDGNRHSKVKKACLISTPLQLNKTSKKLETLSNRFFYQRVFTKTMKKKVLLKHKKTPLPIDLKKVKRAKWVSEFDDLVIAPLYGYESGHHYRELASPLSHIEKLKIPTYILNSKDDPFLTKESYPEELAKNSEIIFLETPKTGGHVGFIKRSFEEHYWYELRVLDFITLSPKEFQQKNNKI